MKLVWALGAAAGVWWAVTHLGPRGHLAADPIRYVPLSPELLEIYAPGRCAPMVDEIVTHPNWSIGVATGHYGCEGFYERAKYEVHSDGAVDYSWLGMTRTLHLTSTDLALVRQLGRFDCEPHRRHETALWIGLGAPADGNGVEVSTESTAGHLLDLLLENATARYVDERAGQLADARLDLRAGKLRITLDRHTLRVRRLKRVLAERALEPGQLVDLIDALTRFTAAPGEAPIARGILRVNGVTVGVEVPRGAWDGFDPVRGLVEEARR